MSLKKRLFQSNMLFLFLALVSMLLVGAGVLMIFEDSFERRFETPEMEAALRQSYLLFILVFLLIGMGVIVVLLAGSGVGLVLLLVAFTYWISILGG